MTATPAAAGAKMSVRNLKKSFGSNEVLKGKGGHPKIFETRDAATAAAGEALVAYINGSLVRDGEKLKAASAADAAFNLKPFIKQRGSERRTIVERVGGDA